MTMFAAVAEAMADDVLAFARSWRPHLIVYEPRAYVGLLAGWILGVPVIRHLWGTDYTFRRWGLEGPALNQLWTRFGVRDVDPLGALTVDPCPPSLQVPTTAHRQPMRYIPYNGPGSIPSWLLEPPHRPRVCVTWGTTFGAIAGHVSPARLSLDALAKLDVEVVVAVSAAQRHLLGELPGGARVVESMPLHLLLPSCAAIVHQGGAGTTITSIVCGVPQVIVPTIADEPMNARRVEESGAGRGVEQWLASPEKIRAAVTELLVNPTFRQGTERLRREVADQPGPAEVVDVLQALTRTSRRRRGG
jgi:UDP:flavonoid glycosyltransferase YjiC (YdhE family)